MSVGFRDPGCFHLRVLETSAFSQNGGRGGGERMCTSKGKSLVAGGTVTTWAHVLLVETSHGTPTRCKWLGDGVPG